MIKVAMILDDPGKGGAYKVAKDIGEGLSQQLFIVKYFFLCERHKNHIQGVFLGEPSIGIDYSVKSYLRLAYFPREQQTTCVALNEALMNYEPDIVHFHSHPTLLPLIRGVRKCGLNMPILFTDHLQRVRHNDPLWPRVFMAKVY